MALGIWLIGIMLLMVSALQFIWKYIRRGLLFVGKVNSVLLLTIFYFVILGPVAIIFQLINAVFQKQKRKRSYWLARSQEKETEETLLRQF